MRFARFFQAHSDARLTCVNVLRLSRMGIDASEDEEGRNLHLRRLAELKYWAKELPAPAHGITFHVLEAPNPPAALLDYAHNTHVDRIVIGARASSPLRRYLGSVSSQVAAEARYTVTVVRAHEIAAARGDSACNSKSTGASLICCPRVGHRDC